MLRREAGIESVSVLLGGAEENRTPDLRIANATLSQLSYRPVTICAPNDNQKSLERQRALERVMGIEPTLSAWEAEVLPLNYTRKNLRTWLPRPDLTSAIMTS